MHLEAAGGLRVDEEVGGWAPGVCDGVEGEQHKKQGEISVNGASSVCSQAHF